MLLPLLLAVLCLLSSSGAEFDDFMQWFRSNGGVDTGVAVKSFSPGYRGIECKQNIRENTQVLQIPLNLSLSASKTATDPVHQQIIRSFDLPDSALIAILLFEKYKEQSFWKPYLDTLPRETHNALHFSKEELEAFQNPSLKTRILNLQRQLNETFQSFVAKWDEVGVSDAHISIEDFKWASSVIDR